MHTDLDTFAHKHAFSVDDVRNAINAVDVEDLDEDETVDHEELEEFLDILIQESAELIITEGYLEDYARERAEDMGALVDQWPYTCIDWEDAADELASDLTVIEFAGETFYVVF